MSTTTTDTRRSMYATYADHHDATITRRAREGRARGDGQGWGFLDDTLQVAAARMGAIVLGSHGEGLLCEVSDRLYHLADSNGPWAVEVATQADLDVLAKRLALRVD